MAVLKIENVHAGYYRGLDTIRGVSITARGGQITAILGANGVGKSTLLKVVAGFITPTEGQIELDGQSLIGVPTHSMVRLGIAYIPQSRGIFEDMTVEENLIIGAWSFRRDSARAAAALEKTYVQFPMLRDKRSQKAGLLSGGQQRMVEIGRSLMADPLVVLVDEPTAGLAKRVWRDVYDMLGTLREQGKAVVLVDQEIREALKIADYAYVLDLGRVRSDGPPSMFRDLTKSFWL